MSIQNVFIQTFFVPTRLSSISQQVPNLNTNMTALKTFVCCQICIRFSRSPTLEIKMYLFFGIMPFYKSIEILCTRKGRLTVLILGFYIVFLYHISGHISIF